MHLCAVHRGTLGDFAECGFVHALPLLVEVSPL